jgi:hypothetical protein
MDAHYTMVSQRNFFLLKLRKFAEFAQFLSGGFPAACLFAFGAVLLAVLMTFAADAGTLAACGTDHLSHGARKLSPLLRTDVQRAMLFAIGCFAASSDKAGLVFFLHR